jgi:hypothetical protein
LVEVQRSLAAVQNTPPPITGVAKEATQGGEEGGQQHEAVVPPHRLKLPGLYDTPPSARGRGGLYDTPPSSGGGGGSTGGRRSRDSSGSRRGSLDGSGVAVPHFQLPTDSVARTNSGTPWKKKEIEWERSLRKHEPITQRSRPPPAVATYTEGDASFITPNRGGGGGGGGGGAGDGVGSASARRQATARALTQALGSADKHGARVSRALEQHGPGWRSGGRLEG